MNKNKKDIKDDHYDLLKLIHDDLTMRSNDGVVNISDFIWRRLKKIVLAGDRR